MADLDFLLNRGLVVNYNAHISGGRIDINWVNSSSSLLIPADSESDTVIDVSSLSITRSIKYTILASQDSDYQTNHILLIHDGNLSSIVKYGILCTTQEPLVDFSTDISDGKMRLMARFNQGTGNLFWKKTSLDTVKFEPTMVDRYGDSLRTRADEFILIRT